MSEREFIESYPFTVDSRVVIQLGRESISSSLVAIAELVKNAYDADAEKVIIKFYNLNDKAAATIVIEDDGNGMDSQSLKENWLRIGADIKMRYDRSEYKKRVLTGSKGLGRLGIDRLCDKLVLQSKTRVSNTGIELEIDWTTFETSHSVDLDKIKHSVYRIPGVLRDKYGKFPINTNQQGTRLILSGLKDAWSEEFVGELKGELSRLVSPFKGIKDFDITLKSGYSQLDGRIVSKQYLKAAEWKLHAQIDEQHNVLVEVTSQRFQEKYKDGPTAWKDWIKGRGETPRCGPLRLEMYYVPERSTSVLRDLDLDRNAVMEFLRNNQGIRIYRDQFRVKPYGEPSGEGDWLLLAHRRARQPQAVTQPGWKVALHQAVGAVFITRAENPGLQDQTNREGLVEEPPFYDLRAFAEKSIQYFEVKLHEWSVKQKETSETEKAKQQADGSASESINAIDQLKDNLRKIEKSSETTAGFGVGVNIAGIIDVVGRVEKTIKNTIESAKKYEDILEAETSALQQEKDTLSNLASLGILTVSFGHEIKGAANVASINSQNLKEALAKKQPTLFPGDEKKYSDYLDLIVRNTNFVNTFAKFALENIRWDKRKRRLLQLNQIWKYVKDTFFVSLDSKNITIDDHKISNNLPAIRGFVIDWESIFVNLITNSVWALEDTPAAEREISLIMDCNDESIRISFADSGRGIEKGTENMIFSPTFSTKRNKKGKQIGTGMGLSIVKTFVEDHANGNISVISPGRLGGAEFIIIVPLKK